MNSTFLVIMNNFGKNLNDFFLTKIIMLITVKLKAVKFEIKTKKLPRN